MKLLPIICCILLAGCAAIQPEYKRVALLHVGMTRQEVINSLGQPLKTTRNGAVEVLSYRLADAKPRWGESVPKTAYYLVISHGRVESFGKE